jgi:UDP-N-acetylglucosamine:LPS N-acetylglucosamine transferase
MMLQTEATGAALAARIAFLVNDVSARMRMSAAARRLARPEAAKVIVDRALELVRAC